MSSTPFHWLAVAVIVLTLAGCGNGDRPDAPGTEPGGTASEAQTILQGALDALQSVSSYHMAFSLTNASNGEEYTSSGESTWRAPSDLHTTIDVGGGILTIEALALPPDLYVRIDGTWYLVPADASPETRALAEGGSIDQYTDLIENLDDTTAAGIENIASEAYTRIRGTFDVAAYAASLPEGSVEPDVLADTSFVDPGTIDIWVSLQTGRIGRVVMDFRYVVSGEDEASFLFEADLDRYNDSSGFPERPIDPPEFEGF